MVDIDKLIEKAVFDSDYLVRESQRKKIGDLASTLGIFPASIQRLYEAAANGEYTNKTVPAVNIRGMTYHVARAMFRAALKYKVGAFIFEIARTEMVYTGQPAVEYVACILAAAIKEYFRGPVFIQGDHFQVNHTKYIPDSGKEMAAIQQSTRDAISAGFLNMDIDTSTLVDLTKQNIAEQQETNCLVAADMTRFIREIEPEGVTVSVGGEIGEVGSTNSTVEELRAFMEGYFNKLGEDVKGISKISIQNGTTHGGVILPDGSIAEVKLDFNVIEELGKVAQQEYGLGGVVQHGASTLPEEMFELFPKAGTLEVHLAQAFQNLIYDSPYFPKDLRERMYGYLLDNYIKEKVSGDNNEQFFYKTRKKAFGAFKNEVWHLPEENITEISGVLEDKFSLMFQRLNVAGTMELINKYYSTLGSINS